MAEIVWIVDADKAHFIGGQGISNKYIIPGPKVTFAPEKLANSTIWVVLRGSSGDRLFAILSVEAVERFMDGYYKGDFLLWCRQSRSFKTSGNYSEGESFSLGHVLDSRSNVSILEDDACILAFKNTLRKNVSLKLLPPDERRIEEIGEIQKYGAATKTVSSCIALVASRLPLNQIWGNGGGAGLLPFSNFSYALIKKRFGEEFAATVVDELMKQDPVKLYAYPHEKKAAAGKDEQSAYQHLPAVTVDLDFTPIDPKMIYAREFVAGLSEQRLNLQEMLSKTERAERFHQEILRDISEYLLKACKIPLQSSSVDLLLREDGQQTVFEIKTTNPANILAQAAKGLFQLAAYKKAILEQGGVVAEQILIITRINSAALESFVKDVAVLMGAKCFVYDKSKEWPHRLEGACW